MTMILNVLGQGYMEDGGNILIKVKDLEIVLEENYLHSSSWDGIDYKIKYNKRNISLKDGTY